MVGRTRSTTPRPLGALFLVPLVLVLVLVLVPAPAAGQPGASRTPAAGWAPPVDAPVLDPFRLPAQRWGAGNRGLAYGAADGQTVVAVDDGVVSFAGRVGGHLHATVDHGGGLRSTYAYLSSVAVVRGQHVVRGQVLATATAGFHLTARLGDRYVDPAPLLAGVAEVPRLQPDPSSGSARAPAAPPVGSAWPVLRRVGSLLGGVTRWAAGSAAEASTTAGAVVAGAVGATGGVLGPTGRGGEQLLALATTSAGPRAVAGGWPAVVHAVSGSRLDPSRALAQLVLDLLPSNQAVALARAITSWQRTGDDCTADGVPVPPSARGRVLIQVGGLGTSSRGASIGKLDPGAVGYEPRNVVGFSYAGGCTPVPFGFEAAPAGSLAAALEARDYSAIDTHQDLEVSASRLADLVDAVRAERPDAPIDLAAHSLGGVVARRAVEILADRHADDVPVSVVLTVGSPHHGAELATASAALPLEPELGALLGAASPGRAFEASADSVSQLARATTTQLPDPREPPPGVRVVSVAAPGDLVVPADRSRWDGAVNAVAGSLDEVGLDVHGRLPGLPEVSRELGLALAGLPARCTSFATAAGAALVSRGVATGEAVAAIGALALAWP